MMIGEREMDDMTKIDQGTFPPIFANPNPSYCFLAITSSASTSNMSRASLSGNSFKTFFAPSAWSRASCLVREIPDDLQTNSRA